MLDNMLTWVKLQVNDVKRRVNKYICIYLPPKCFIRNLVMRPILVWKKTK